MHGFQGKNGDSAKKYVEISDIGGQKVNSVLNNAAQFIDIIETSRTQDVKKLWEVFLFFFAKSPRDILHF